MGNYPEWAGSYPNKHPFYISSPEGAAMIETILLVILAWTGISVSIFGAVSLCKIHYSNKSAKRYTTIEGEF